MGSGQEGEGFELKPFDAWSGQRQYKPLPWWQAYNNLKHNRWDNVRDATVANAVEATAALFIAIATDSGCRAVLAERRWLHSHYASDWTLAKLASPEGILGVTVESTLFSYAIGSSNPNFNRMLAYYNGCTRDLASGWKQSTAVISGSDRDPRGDARRQRCAPLATPYPPDPRPPGLRRGTCLVPSDLFQSGPVNRP